MPLLQLNIRGKLLLLFFALALVPMAAVGVIAYFNSVGSVEKVVEQRNLATVREVADNVQRQFELRPSEIALLARNQEIQDFYALYASAGNATLERMEPQLLAFFQHFFTGPRQIFVRARYLDPTGQLLLTYARTSGIDLNQEPYALSNVDTAFTGVDTQALPQHGDLFYLNEYDQTYGPILRAGRWIISRENGHRLGLLLVDLEINGLLQDAAIPRTFSNNEQLFIVELDHQRLISHPSPSWIGQSLTTAFPGLTQVYPAAATPTQGVAHYTDEGEKWLVSYAHLADLNWSVATLSRLSVFTGPVQQTALFNLGIALAAALLALILVPLVIGRISGSIYRVAAGAQAVAAGDLNQEIAVKARDETHTLATSFNHMARSLRSTLGELRQLNQDLEQRVQDRTAELQTANQRLERERSMERVRSEIAAMKSSEDLPDLVVEILNELETVGVDFEACNINIVDRAAAVRRQYAYAMNPSELLIQSEQPLADVSQAFLSIWQGGKTVVRHGDELFSITDSRHKVGLTTNPTAVLDAPFTYGTLSFSTLNPNGFSDDEIALVEEFARVLELGYARFLDFQALEESNRQIQEANRLKSDFLARMSHDLRTPMNAIVGYTRIMQRKAKDALDERQYGNLANIRVSADHLLSLINDILDLSKIEAGRLDIQPEDVDVQRLIGQCTTAVAPLVKPGVELVHQLDGGNTLHTDADRLRRVVMNLLGNAVKFTEQGNITVSLTALDTGVKLEVADTGIGIPPEDLPYIFDEFRQVNDKGGKTQEGSGLGLAIAKKSVELLGGTISAESEVGKGTKFALQIDNYNG